MPLVYVIIDNDTITILRCFEKSQCEWEIIDKWLCLCIVLLKIDIFCHATQHDLFVFSNWIEKKN